jgi:hypothetical protein
MRPVISRLAKSARAACQSAVEYDPTTAQPTGGGGTKYDSDCGSILGSGGGRKRFGGCEESGICGEGVVMLASAIAIVSVAFAFSNLNDRARLRDQFFDASDSRLPFAAEAR